MGGVCLVASYYSIPNRLGDHTVSLSLKTYVPLLKAEKFLTVVFGLALLTAAYWLFMGMAPIFYMEGMGVSLKHFGYYQGSPSLTFALVCILSSKMLTLFGQKRCLYFGLRACFVSAILMMGMALLQIHQPYIITAVLIILSAGIVFPINILYPYSLEILPHSKGRSAGLGQTIVLLLTASLIELVAYFYHGQFMPIGATMFMAIMVSMTLIQRIMKKKWLTFSML
jgi:DHA1 family bicyclomycin/chloramphenicol resistance-like MFS transporter